MTNFFKEFFSDDDSIIGLCAFETERERKLKRIKRNVAKLENSYSTIIFKKNLNKFIVENFTGQTPCRV